MGKIFLDSYEHMDIYSDYVYIIYICNTHVHYVFTHSIHIYLYVHTHRIYVYIYMHSHVQDVYFNMYINLHILYILHVYIM